MLSNLSFTGAEVFLGLFLMILLFLSVILIGRNRLAKTSSENLKNKHANDTKVDRIKGRNKYPEVDVFNYSNVFWNLGLVLTLALVVVSLNWTQFEDKVYIPEDAMDMEFDLELESPPQTTTPPPPPPPPPPIIEEVPSDVILDEPDSFADQSADLNTSIANAPKASKTSAPPPPPPPPPPAIEVKEIFKVVEEMPRFPGCENLGSIEEKKACAQKKLLEFVYANIQYPSLARENNVSGTSVVRFVVNEDGSIGQVEILRDIGAGCGEEAVRIVNLMNTLPERWIAGKQRGRNVKVYFTFPVKFKLVSG